MDDLLDDAIYRAGRTRPELPCLQVVTTRFNMVMRAFERDGFLSGAGDKEGWLAARIPIFESVCLPSLVNQSRRPDLWLLGFDLNREREVAPILDMIAPHPWIVPVWQKTQEGRPDNFERCFRRSIVERLKPEHQWVLTTRLDNDDALSLTFCEAAREYTGAVISANPQDGDFWISFPLGVQFANGECRLMPQTGNAFLSRCVRVGAGSSVEWGTAQSGSHRHIFESGKVYLPVTRRPMWLQNVHGTNLLNREKTGLSVLRDTDAELARFGIQLESPSPQRSIRRTMLRVRQQPKFWKSIARRVGDALRRMGLKDKRPPTPFKRSP
jgi:hypothetical protein